MSPKFFSVAVCLEPPLNLEKLDKCINSSTNNIKKWSYLPDTGECAFLSAAQECAIESGNDFKNEHECRETCFYGIHIQLLIFAPICSGTIRENDAN